MKKYKSLILAGLLAVTIPVAQAAPPSIPLFTTNLLSAVSSVAIAATTTSNYVSGPFPVYRGRGFAVSLYAVGAAGTAANAELYFKFKVDNTNYTTTTVSVTNSINGTNVYRGYTLVPPTTVDNVQVGELSSIVWQGTNALTVSNLMVSVFP